MRSLQSYYCGPVVLPEGAQAVGCYTQGDNGIVMVVVDAPTPWTATEAREFGCVGGDAVITRPYRYIGTVLPGGFPSHVVEYLPE